MQGIAFDCSTSVLTVCVWRDDQKYFYHQQAPRQHASLLLPVIEQLLLEAGWTMSQTDCIAVGCGPGSFIGVRTALAAAKTLAWAGDIQCVGCSSLQVLAQTCYQQRGAEQVLAAWDARMNSIYWGCYQLDVDKIMQPVQRDALGLPNEVKWPLVSSNVFAAGNAWAVYADDLLVPLSVCFDVESALFPHASALCDLAESACRKGESVNALQLVPQYLRDQVARRPK